MTQDYRLTITGLNDDLVSFSAEVATDVANDDSPWVSVQQWTVANPQLSGRERSTFLEQAAADNGWTLRPGSRRPTGGGVLVAAAEPADWELVLAAATQTAAHYRRVETAWHALIAASPLSVVQIADIAGFGRHRIYQIQNQINGPPRPPESDQTILTCPSTRSAVFEVADAAVGRHFCPITTPRG